MGYSHPPCQPHPPPFPLHPCFMARFCYCSLAHLAVWNEQVSTILLTPPCELADTREHCQEWRLCLGLNMWGFMICWVCHLKCARSVCDSARGDARVYICKCVFMDGLREMDFPFGACMLTVLLTLQLDWQVHDARASCLLWGDLQL